MTPKWTGFRLIPPRDWWLKGRWSFNHPISHLLGGLVLAPVLLLLWPDAEAWRRLLVVAFIAAFREEAQIEFTPPYPVYSAVWDTVFVLLGAATVEFFWLFVVR